MGKALGSIACERLIADRMFPFSHFREMLSPFPRTPSSFSSRCTIKSVLQFCVLSTPRKRSVENSGNRGVILKLHHPVLRISVEGVNIDSRRSKSGRFGRDFPSPTAASSASGNCALSVRDPCEGVRVNHLHPHLSRHIPMKENC